MPNIFIRGMLFLSSYFPLMLIISILLLGKQFGLSVALFVFLSVLLIVYINTNMIYINPMLNMLGYHLYEVHIEHSALSHYYIARQRLIRGEMISFVRLSDDIFLERVR